MQNVSLYSAKITKKKTLKELLPEVLAKNNSNPDDFTKEFANLLQRWLME